MAKKMCELFKNTYICRPKFLKKANEKAYD